MSQVSVELPLGLLATQLETVTVRLPLVQPRYLYPVLPAFALCAGIALVRSLGPRWTAAPAACSTAMLAALWIYLTTVPTIGG